MDTYVFPVSIFLSSLGVFLDLFTTHIAIKDVGIELETNPYVRKMFAKGKCGELILYEALLVLCWAVLDFQGLLSSLLFLGLFWCVVRGLMGISNLKVIIEYRVLGKERCKERVELRRMLKAANIKYRIGRKLLPASLLAFYLLIYFSVQDILTKSILWGLVGYYVYAVLYD